MDKSQQKIKVLKNGPYVVTNGIPIMEKIIVNKNGKQELEEGRKLPQSDQYSLCRCGKSKNSPFCDGTHIEVEFDGTETIANTKYTHRAELVEGEGVNLLDDGRCAYGRFCHHEKGTAWELVEKSYDLECKEAAIEATVACPSGRLTAVDKEGNLIENTYEPLIEVIQDPQKGVNAGIYVKGNITIESADNVVYETRNRVALCRCGKSKNKPICDASHIGH